MDYLSDEEKELVVAFTKNNKMSEAVRKVLLAGIYDNGTLKPEERAQPTRNFALKLFFSHQGETISDEALGQDLRGCAMGITMLESAFNKMIEMSLPTPAAPDSGKNQAR